MSSWIPVNLRSALFGLVLFFLNMGQVSAQPKLVWDPNLEEDLGGYRVYVVDYAREYPSVQKNLLNLHSLTNLDAETTYWIYVTAYNTNGFESEPSTVLQFPAGGCNYTISPRASPGLSPWGGFDYFRVITASGCPWTVFTTNEWITITSVSTGEGLSRIYYSVDQNRTFSPRMGSIFVANQTFTVSQAAGGVPFVSNPLSEARVQLNEGDTFDISVGAVEQYELHYQWFRNDVLLEAATNSYLTIFSLTPEDQGKYTVSISSAAVSVPNGPVELIVYPKPRIEDAGQPRNAAALLGGPAYLSVTATGPDLSYEWRKDGQVTGFNSRALFIPSVRTNDLGTYEVEVSNPAGSVLSRPARIFTGTADQLNGKLKIVVTNDPYRIDVQASALPDEVYDIQVSSDLIEWVTVGSIAADIVGRFQIEVPQTATVTRWFVRTVRRANP